ncbi:MAG: hypothetical protein KDA17_07190 [Candidatus Saccharibacteria bacterium]|nr:hypothetical protein [Candidatus Saccharibacteria bacterium]
MSRYFAHLDSQGDLIGFYIDTVNPVIPEDVVEITKAQWQDWVRNQKTRKWKSGSLEVVERQEPERELIVSETDALLQLLKERLSISDQDIATKKDDMSVRKK